MSDSFDVVVVGAGPGGYVTAIRASQLGLKAAIVEREALGGVCLNWGCIPTKALLKSGEVYEQLGHLADYGLSVEGRAYDFSKVIERSRGVAKQLSAGVAFLMKKHKIEVVDGAAKLEKGQGAPKVVVALKAGGGRTLIARSVILATPVFRSRVEKMATLRSLVKPDVVTPFRANRMNASSFSPSETEQSGKVEYDRIFSLSFLA